MSTVGVLSARGRVEEKALMAALAQAGIVSAIFPPVDEPLPIGPLPVTPDGHPFPVPQLVIDRHRNRQIARSVLSTCRALGVPALSAGIAATGDRLDVASALSVHGLPRPMTALCTSEDAALKAVEASGLPATLLPLDLQAQAIALLDRDTAEAILEHRAVLGGAERSLGLVQAGSPVNGHLSTIIVIDGVASAIQPSGSASTTDEGLHLAEEAALALQADLIAVVIASIDGASLVWDVQPAPDFRDALPLLGTSVAATIARAVELRLEALSEARLPHARTVSWMSITREGMHGDVVVRA